MKRLHILGICGTFMGGIALIARELGWQVSGSDQNIYPPMSDTLRAAGIEMYEGFDPAHLKPKPDIVVVGNALSRGNPELEAVLTEAIPYTSGPQWLAEEVLYKRWVLAVSGTHGKTTTTAILTWILAASGLKPGFLIGGVPQDFSVTAALGSDPFFVIEADEYDTAFFDKRSKFLHYRPRTLLMNNLEFDHADIFDDLPAIQKQFQYLLRTVPNKGLVVHPVGVPAIDEVIQRGCWSALESFGVEQGDWQIHQVNQDGSEFELWHQGGVYPVKWSQYGLHNVHNAVAAIACAHHAGVSVDDAVTALQTFKGVKRRLEVRGKMNDITVYDDFAHHPTAISSTIGALRSRIGKSRLMAVIQLGSNTMRMGVHQQALIDSFKDADCVVILDPKDPHWDVRALAQELKMPHQVCNTVDEIIQYLLKTMKAEDHILIMSNKGFDGLHQRLLDSIKTR